MKFVSDYKEFDRRQKESLLDYVSEIAIPQKDIVLSYMKKGEDLGVRCSSVYDYVKKESTGKTIHCYTDGEFEWDDKEIYHFEHYNLKLDDEFIQKVLRSE